MCAAPPVAHPDRAARRRSPTPHVVSELDDAGTTIALADNEVRVLRAGAGKVRNLLPWVPIDLDLHIFPTSDTRMSHGCDTPRRAAEQVAHESEQLQQRHARITVCRVRPLPQLGPSPINQLLEL